MLKKAPKIIFKCVLLLVVGFGIFLFGLYQGSEAQKRIDSQKAIEEQSNKVAIDESKCPVTIPGGIYKEYVRLVNEVDVVREPVFIENLEVVILNEPFNEKEFEKGLYQLITHKGWDSREFDVDEDGEDETIINANVAMTHSPHIAMVVKNGNIIFKAGGAGVWIEEVYGNQGFILKETVDWNIGEESRTRYISKDGGFMPVWTQKVCWVKFE